MAMLSEQFPNAPELLDVYALAWNGNRAEEDGALRNPDRRNQGFCSKVGRKTIGKP